jgi:hypothetical protein
LLLIDKYCKFIGLIEIIQKSCLNLLIEGVELEVVSKYEICVTKSNIEDVDCVVDCESLLYIFLHSVSKNSMSYWLLFK